MIIILLPIPPRQGLPLTKVFPPVEKDTEKLYQANKTLSIDHKR